VVERLHERSVTIPRARTALLIIDVQMDFAFRREQGLARSTPEAEDNIAALLNAFRKHGLTICHVHHHSLEPGSPLTAGPPGAEVQTFVAPDPGESVYVKHANSGFIGTTLEADLRRRGIDTIVTCGATANHCVETTARMGANLGLRVIYPADAVWTYATAGPDGRHHSADDVLSVTLASLDGEFAKVVATRAVLDAILAGDKSGRA